MTNPLLSMVDEDTRRALLIDQLRKRGLPVPEDLLHPLREKEVARRGLVGTVGTFHDFVANVNPDLLRYEHIPKLIDIGQRIVDRELDRVMILMPPRYFKSEVASRLLTAYYLRVHPVAKIALTSYTAHLAWELSEAAREYFQRAGGKLRERGSSREHWLTQDGGGLWAVGMGGTLTGRGFNLGVVDDPINPQHAHSPLYQRSFSHWWSDVWLSRQEPHMSTGRQLAQIVVVMQRLGPSDPIDYLFRRESGEQIDQSMESWHVVLMDEIKSDEPLGRWKGPRGLPESCTIEPDTRKVGQVLAPSRFPKEAVKSAQEGSPLTVAAQRQQRPMQATGLFWRSNQFGEYDTLPPDAHNGGLDWDTAYTQEEGNSASAYIRSYHGMAPTDRPGEFPIYIDDVGWDWHEFPALVKWIKSLTGPHYVEEKATGKSVVQALKTYGVKAEEVIVEGNKLARASVAQPVVANGRVYVNKKIIKKLLWGERQGLLRVTAEALQMGHGVEGLDVNDAFVQALHRHTGVSGMGKKFPLKFG